MEILEAKYGNSNYLINVIDKIEKYKNNDIIFIPKDIQINKLFCVDPNVGGSKYIKVMWKKTTIKQIVLRERCDTIIDEVKYGRKRAVKIEMNNLYSHRRILHKFTITKILYGISREESVDITSCLRSKIYSIDYYIDIYNLNINSLVADPYVNREKNLYIDFEETSVFENIIYEKCGKLRKDLVIGIDLNMYKLNLISHIVPKKSEIFTLNMEYLKNILSVFNNKKILSIVSGAGLEEKEYLSNWINLDNFTCIYKQNDPKLGEAVSIRDLINGVKSYDKNEYTFYCHSKGITRNNGKDPTIAVWIELMHKYCLSNIDTVIYHDSYTGGAIRCYDKFPNVIKSPEWHYSGTFFWFSHKIFDKIDILSKLTNEYYIVEMLPGLICNLNKSHCFYKDNVKPYYECFLKTNKYDIIKNMDLVESELSKSIEKILDRY
jgi:hypothetical protein